MADLGKGDVLVMCTARWCVACKRYSQETLEEMCRSRGVAYVLVDVEEAEQGGEWDRMLEEHSVEELPTFLLLRDGKLLGSYTGVTHKRPMRSIAQLLSRHGR